MLSIATLFPHIDHHLDSVTSSQICTNESMSKFLNNSSVCLDMLQPIFLIPIH